MCCLGKSGKESVVFSFGQLLFQTAEPPVGTNKHCRNSDPDNEHDGKHDEELVFRQHHLLDPFRQGVFAWMLFSHKVCRWLLPWAAPLGLVGLMLLTLPVFLPMFEALNVDLIWLGVIIVKYIEIGLLTPPVGLNLYVLSSISHAGIAEVVRGISHLVASSVDGIDAGEVGLQWRGAGLVQGGSVHAGGIEVADQLGHARCIGIGGVRIDRAVSAQLIDALAPHAIDAALEAAARAGRADDDVRLALGRQLEEAKYEALLAARRHQVIDRDKRLVARELEARWEAALEHVAQLDGRGSRRGARLAGEPDAARAGDEGVRPSSFRSATANLL